MVHVVTMLFSVMTAQADFPNWVPSELMNGERYADRRTRAVAALSGSVAFERISDKVRITIRVGRNTQNPNQPIRVSSDVGQPRVAPSGLPLGRQSLESLRPGSLQLSVVSDWEEGQISFTAPPLREKFQLPRRPDDFTSERVFVEALLRKSLSGYASRRLSSTTAISIGGHSQEAFIAKKSGAILVDFEKVATSLEIGCNRNDADGRIAFSLSGHSYLLVLGSDRMKKDAAWVELPDVVMLQDGRWLVPREVFLGS